MRQVHGSGIAAVALALAAVGCGDATGPAATNGAPQTNFESDLLNSSQHGPTRGGAGGEFAIPVDAISRRGPGRDG